MKLDTLIHATGEQPSWPSGAVPATVVPATVAAVAIVGTPVVSTGTPAVFGGNFGGNF